MTVRHSPEQLTSEHSKFWSKIATKYDSVLDLQIGADTRAMVRRRLAREPRLGVAVEFGCGTGYFTEMLANRADTVLATDVAPGMLSLAKQRLKAANVRFQEEDCQKTSFADSTFDTAFMCLVIHFTDKAKTLKEMHRILKPGGMLIIANGHPGALSRVNRLRWLVRGFYYGITRHRTKPPKGITKNLVTLAGLSDLLTENGFRILYAKTIQSPSSPSNMPVDYVKAVKRQFTNPKTVGDGVRNRGLTVAAG